VSEIWTIQRVLTWTSDYFKRKDIDSPRLTAELLLAEVLGCDRVRLYVDFERPLEAGELARYRKLVERRISGEPTHYLLGRRDFFGRTFRVDPRVLVPRPETELVIEAALEKLPEGATVPVLDLCTGSGIIAVTLAAERPDLEVVAVDLSEGALEVARENVRSLVPERVELLQGDLFGPLQDRVFQLIASNPPYVKTETIRELSAEVRHEPQMALDGGPDGLSVVRRIAQEAPGHLLSGGWLILEIGEDQGPAVKAILSEAGFADVAVRPDLARLDRIALARRP